MARNLKMVVVHIELFTSRAVSNLDENTLLRRVLYT